MCLYIEGFDYYKCQQNVNFLRSISAACRFELRTLICRLYAGRKNIDES